MTVVSSCPGAASEDHSNDKTIQTSKISSESAAFQRSDLHLVVPIEREPPEVDNQQPSCSLASPTKDPCMCLLSSHQSSPSPPRLPAHTIHKLLPTPIRCHTGQTSRIRSRPRSKPRPHVPASRNHEWIFLRLCRDILRLRWESRSQKVTSAYTGWSWIIIMWL